MQPRIGVPSDQFDRRFSRHRIYARRQGALFACPRKGIASNALILFLSMGLAAKLKASAAPLMMFVSSCRFSERRT
jgi:hypothetical protein